MYRLIVSMFLVVSFTFPFGGSVYAKQRQELVVIDSPLSSNLEGEILENPVRNFSDSGNEWIEHQDTALIDLHSNKSIEATFETQMELFEKQLDICEIDSELAAIQTEIKSLIELYNNDKKAFMEKKARFEELRKRYYMLKEEKQKITAE